MSLAKRIPILKNPLKIFFFLNLTNLVLNAKEVHAQKVTQHSVLRKYCSFDLLNNTDLYNIVLTQYR